MLSNLPVVFIIFTYLQSTLSLFSPILLYPHEISTRSIAVEWSTVVDGEADIFLATIYPLDEEESAEAVQYTQQTYAIWNGLVPGKTYNISVVAEDVSGTISMPTFITVSTDPLPPYNVHVSKFVNPVLTEYLVGKNLTLLYPVYGVILMWEGPDSGHFDGFHVEVTPPDGVINPPITLDQGEPVADVTKKRRIVWDLVPGVHYDFEVSTRSNGRLSAVATSGTRMPPEVPGLIVVTSVTPTTITLAWSDPHRGVLDGYNIEADPPDGVVVEGNDPEDKWRRIQDLTPGTHYSFEVYSSSAGILSYKSRAAEAITPPAAPQGPTRTSSTTNSISISWGRPHGRVDHYEVVYFPKFYGVGRIRHVVYDTAVRLTSLMPETEYSVIIHTVSNKLYSQPLLITSISTAPLFPQTNFRTTTSQFRASTTPVLIAQTTSPRSPTTTEVQASLRTSSSSRVPTVPLISATTRTTTTTIPAAATTIPMTTKTTIPGTTTQLPTTFPISTTSQLPSSFQMSTAAPATDSLALISTIKSTPQNELAIQTTSSIANLNLPEFTTLKSSLETSMSLPQSTNPNAVTSTPNSSSNTESVSSPNRLTEMPAITQYSSTAKKDTTQIFISGDSLLNQLNTDSVTNVYGATNLYLPNTKDSVSPQAIVSRSVTNPDITSTQLLSNTSLSQSLFATSTPSENDLTDVPLNTNLTMEPEYSSIISATGDLNINNYTGITDGFAVVGSDTTTMSTISQNQTSISTTTVAGDNKTKAIDDMKASSMAFTTRSSEAPFVTNFSSLTTSNLESLSTAPLEAPISSTLMASLNTPSWNASLLTDAISTSTPRQNSSVPKGNLGTTMPSEVVLSISNTTVIKTEGASLSRTSTFLENINTTSLPNVTDEVLATTLSRNLSNIILTSTAQSDLTTKLNITSSTMESDGTPSAVSTDTHPFPTSIHSLFPTSTNQILHTSTSSNLQLNTTSMSATTLEQSAMFLTTQITNVSNSPNQTLGRPIASAPNFFTSSASSETTSIPFSGNSVTTSAYNQNISSSTNNAINTGMPQLATQTFISFSNNLNTETTHNATTSTAPTQSSSGEVFNQESTTFVTRGSVTMVSNAQDTNTSQNPGISLTSQGTSQTNTSDASSNFDATVSANSNASSSNLGLTSLTTLKMDSSTQNFGTSTTSNSASNISSSTPSAVPFQTTQDPNVPNVTTQQRTRTLVGGSLSSLSIQFQTTQNPNVANQTTQILPGTSSVLFQTTQNPDVSNQTSQQPSGTLVEESLTVSSESFSTTRSPNMSNLTTLEAPGALVAGTAGPFLTTQAPLSNSETANQSVNNVNATMHTSITPSVGLFQTMDSKTASNQANSSSSTVQIDGTQYLTHTSSVVFSTGQRTNALMETTTMDTVMTNSNMQVPTSSLSSTHAQTFNTQTPNPSFPTTQGVDKISIANTQVPTPQVNFSREVSTPPSIPPNTSAIIQGSTANFSLAEELTTQQPNTLFVSTQSTGVQFQTSHSSNLINSTTNQSSSTISNNFDTTTSLIDPNMVSTPNPNSTLSPPFILVIGTRSLTNLGGGNPNFRFPNNGSTTTNALDTKIEQIGSTNSPYQTSNTSSTNQENSRETFTSAILRNNLSTTPSTQSHTMNQMTETLSSSSAASRISTVPTIKTATMIQSSQSTIIQEPGNTSDGYQTPSAHSLSSFSNQATTRLLVSPRLLTSTTQNWSSTVLLNTDENKESSISAAFTRSSTDDSPIIRGGDGFDHDSTGSGSTPISVSSFSLSTTEAAQSTSDGSGQTPKLNSRNIINRTVTPTSPNANTITSNIDATTNAIPDIRETANGNSNSNIQVNGTGISTICKLNNITVVVDKSIIGQYESMYGPLHLNDGTNETCRGVEHGDYYRYTIAPNILDCGTTIELNETHVNFTNTVSNRMQKNSWQSSGFGDSGVILGPRVSRQPFKFINMRIWCTFPLTQNVTSVFPFLPQLTVQIININISGQGEFSAIMQLYKTSLYEEPYLFPPTLNSSDKIYVGVSLMETLDNATFVVVQDCWGTPGRSPNDSQTYPIIHNGCSVNGSLDGSVRIVGNGEGKRVKWEGNVFKFLSFPEVWLHCSIQICFGGNCKPNCERNRAKRSASDGTKMSVLSTGPISIRRVNAVLTTPIQPTVKGITESPLLPFIPDVLVLILIAILVTLILISCIVLFFLAAGWRRRQRHESKPETVTSSQAIPLPLEQPVARDDDYLTITPQKDETLLKSARGYSVADNTTVGTLTMSTFSDRSNTLNSQVSGRGSINKSYVSDERTASVSNINEISLERTVNAQFPNTLSTRTNSTASFRTIDSTNATSAF